jgi:hypothetical protein
MGATNVVALDKIGNIGEGAGAKSPAWPSRFLIEIKIAP